MTKPCALLDEAMESLTRSFGPDHPYVALLHESLAMLSEERDDDAAAEVHWRETVRIRNAALPEAHPLRANALNLSEGYESFRKALGPDAEETRSARQRLMEATGEG